MRPHWKGISLAFHSAPGLLHDMPTLKAAVSCGGGKTHRKQITEPLKWDHVVHISQLPSPILQMSKVRLEELTQVTLTTLCCPNWLLSVTFADYLGSLIFSHNCPRGPLNSSNSFCYAEMENKVREGKEKGLPIFLTHSPLSHTLLSGTIIWGHCWTSCRTRQQCLLCS